MKKRFLIAAAAIGLLVAALVVGVRLALPPARLLALLEPRLEAALGRDVDIGTASLRWMPLAARLENVRVRANPGFSSPHLLELGAIQLELGLLPLLRRQMDVRALVLEAPHVVLEQNAAGEWNAAPRAIGTPGAPGRAPGRSTPMALGIRRLTLSDGSVRWSSAQRALAIEAPLTAELAVRIDRTRRVRVEGWIESAAVAVRGALGTLPPLPVRLETVLEIADSNAVVESLRVRLRDLTVEMEGTAALPPARARLELRTRSRDLDLAALLALLPRERLPELNGVQVAGRARLDLALLAAAPAPPRLTGKVEVADGRLQAPKWPAAIEALQARAVVHGDSVVVESFDARIADAPFHVDGQLFDLAAPARAAYDLRLRTQLDLPTLAALVASFSPRPPAFRVRGRIDADVRARGALAGKAIPHLEGPISLADVRVETARLRAPLALQGRLLGAGSTIQIETLELACGATRLAATGTVHPALPPQLPRLVLHGNATQLDIDSLVVPVAATTTAAADTTAHAAPPRALVPPLPPLRCDADLLIGTARVQQTTFRAAKLDLHSDGHEFRAALQADAVEREALRLAACRAELSGTPALSTGTLQAASGQLGKIHATQLRGDLRVEGTTVTLAPLRARTYDGNLDGSLRLDLANASVPRQELGVKLDAVQLDGLVQDFFHAGALFEGTLRGSSEWTTSGAGAAAVRANLTGEGNGFAVDGRVRQQPLLNQLAQVLGVPGLANLDYRELGFAFTVASGQVKLPHLDVKGDAADASVSGNIGLDGKLDLALAVQLSPALSEQALRSQALRGAGKLFTDARGRLALDFAVRGSLDRPELRVDLERTAKRTDLKALGVQELQRLLAPRGSAAGQDAVGRVLGNAVKDLFRPKPAPRESTAAPRDSTP